MFFEIAIEIIVTLMLTAATIYLFSIVPTDANRILLRIVACITCLVTLVQIVFVCIDFKEIYQKYFA